MSRKYRVESTPEITIYKLVKQKKITRRIGIKVVIMKKNCKQEIVGMRMHQFKVSG